MEGIKGYKVFESDWTCKNFKYEVGKTFEENVIPECCERGFHFCKELKDCFNYYPFDPNNKVAEIIAFGEIDEESDDSKCCTNKIHIVQEISWEDVLRMVNIGKGNAGLRNTGNWNTGNWNTGNWNSGNCNSGNYNSGNYNSGNYNSGNWNTGNCNSGNWNTGNYNSGNYNSGNWNTGNCNSGNYNSGNCNSGNWNSGNWNTGNYNSGNYNSGNWNTGNCNSGNYNSGNCNSGNWNTGNWNRGYCNSGDWNKTNFSNGYFNTEEQKIVLFNKPSDWTYRDWWASDARYILDKIPSDVIEWIQSNNMTDEEKSAHPEHETTGGYLKMYKQTASHQMWWDDLTEHEQDEVKSLPNFDADIFEEITGIVV